MNYSAQPRANQTHALFLVLVAITVAGTFFLIWVHGLLPSKPMASSIDLIVEAYKGLMAPEPTEQFTFAVLAIAIPLLAFFLTPWMAAKPAIAFALTSTYIPIAVAGLLFAPFVASDFTTTVFRDLMEPYSVADTLALLVALVLATMLSVRIIKSRHPVLQRQSTRTALAWASFLSAMFLQMAAWRIVGFASVQPISPWDGHADPLFYVLAQVVAGKTLLVDLPSQYGLFPEFLAPFFKLTGLTVGGLCGLFAAMQVVSLISIFFVLSKVTKSRAILAITGLALVQVTFETVILNAGTAERYFQYWPLRFFWPAVSVAVFYWFCRRPSIQRSVVLSALGAVAFLWNLDSGLFTVVTFAAYLVARGSTCYGRPQHGTWTTRTYGLAFAFHVLITIGVAAFFMTALRLKGGQPLHLRWLVEYQKVFADLGLAMLPLPRKVHPWMSVLGVYLLGMLAAFRSWRDRDAIGRNVDLLFYLSMLGLGLFVYYAGRSHVLNLVTVCWPAVLITALAADELLRSVRAKLLPRAWIGIPVAGCALLLIAASSFVARAPHFAVMSWHQFKTRGVAEDPLAGNELALVRRHAADRDCLIIGKRQGIYSAEANIASPYMGPGIIETVLIADQRRMMDALFAGAYPCVFLGVGPNSTPNFVIDMPRVLARYAVIDQSPGGTMLFLEPKPR